MKNYFTIVMISLLIATFSFTAATAQQKEIQQDALSASVNGKALYANANKGSVHFIRPKSNDPLIDGNAKPVNLQLNDQGWSELPSSAVLEANATEIDLSGNFFESLPEDIGNWERCERFSVRNNRLASLPESMSRWSNLHMLDLTKNQLESLPASFGKLTSLNSLTLDLNYLPTLPLQVCELIRLQELSVRFNSLSSLPGAVSQLKSVKRLYLTNNRLTTVPEEIGRMSSLEMLMLDNNNIRTLPAAISNLKDTLKLLSLKGNPLTDVNMEELRKLLPNTLIEF